MVAGKTAAKLVTTVQKCVSTLVSVKLPNIFTRDHLVLTNVNMTRLSILKKPCLW